MESSPSSSLNVGNRVIARSNLFSPKSGRGIVRVSGRSVHEFVKLRTEYLPSRLRVSTANGGGFRTEGRKGVVGEGDGVIIVDHGSRRKESNLMLNEFVAMFKEKTQYPIVEPAHMELAEPSIKDAFTACIQQGARRVIVSPFFLFPGRHWHQDIPSLTAEAAKEHPGASYVITAPLGLHELLVDVVNDRISYCLSHVAGEEDECSVCAGTGKCRVYS
ncbi:sirohydrochlorin ferrochelatase, chloroplastic isoform X2 [Andrographis paniculata]|uniref:sirohydrochlorin ferrochelatase, chloroplastic isoform X2 n=1 Tax=Andrographis paniculata TaxID=175694 RepID=UPI0021E84896|nr:sirohydrochlorin ferrochelatase, chloroplastic isoform X2 [Andrographis paniculata]